ncbi:ACRO protein, partial [Copsychus sechellarum]|nr:ACRO protein [Copsychus sechellarum]
WPGIASVQVTMENGTWHMCTGALIGQRWVVTAASCFDGAGPVVEWKVLMGATDLAQPGPKAEVFPVKQIVVHQDYVAATVSNNIALLELERPVECSDYIQLGCVPDGSLAVPELKTCYMAGWRAAPASGVGMGRATAAAPDPSLPAQGDIGAPLVCKDNDEDNFWLVGLASWGEGCARARRPGLFTSTQHFHAWIRAHTGPNPAA